VHPVNLCAKHVQCSCRNTITRTAIRDPRLLLGVTNAEVFLQERLWHSRWEANIGIPKTRGLSFGLGHGIHQVAESVPAGTHSAHRLVGFSEGAGTSMVSDAAWVNIPFSCKLIEVFLQEHCGKLAHTSRLVHCDCGAVIEMLPTFVAWHSPWRSRIGR